MRLPFLARDPRPAPPGTMPSAPDHCLTLTTLTDLAEDILSPGDRAAAQAHLQTCADCAQAAIEIRRLSAETRRLHDSVLGYTGPGARFDNTQSALETHRAWTAHCDRCDRCRRRAETLAAARRLIVGPRPGLRTALSFAAGALSCALVLMAVVPLGHAVSPKPVSPGLAGSGGLSQKGTPPDPEAPVSIAQKLLDRLLRPSPQQLPFVIHYWEHERWADPNDRAVREKLVDLYDLAGQLASRPALRAAWQQKRRTELAWLHRHS